MPNLAFPRGVHTVAVLTLAELDRRGQWTPSSKHTTWPSKSNVTNDTLPASGRLACRGFHQYSIRA
jgi:hypothetical protein